MSSPEFAEEAPVVPSQGSDSPKSGEGVVSNGIDSLGVQGIEEPIAERLVDEAVEEAVEQVTRMMGQGERTGPVAESETPRRIELEEESGGDSVMEVSAKVETSRSATTGSGDSPREEGEKKTEEEAKEEYMDILGNGSLRKKTVVPGKGRDTRPLHGDTVTVSYIGRLTDSEREVLNEEVTFVVGDGDVMQALDLAVALADLHEEFELITDPKFAYGSLGLEPNIPPNASLTISAKLLRTDEPPSYSSMPWSRILQTANQKRERGNFLFGRNEFALSINSYNKALEILNSRRTTDAGSPSRSGPDGSGPRRRRSGEDWEPSEGDAANDVYEKWKDEIVDTKVKIYNNMAAAQIRVDAFEAAINSCDEVLKLNPDNVKAWFRRGKAKAGRAEFVEAVRSLRVALKYDPDSRIVQSELKRVMASVKAERETQQRIYRRMFGPSSADGASPASHAPGGRSWRRYLWYASGVAAVGVSLALASAAYKYHQQHT